MTVDSYTSYQGYPVDGSMARARKVTYNIHKNKCNVKKTSLFTGKLIIGIYRKLSEVSPIISDNFIGSDKFIG